MKLHFISISLIATALLLSAGPTCAAENSPEAARVNTGKADISPQSGKSGIAAKRKAHAAIRLVNINGATREQLKQLPGIGNAEADKIIAGRPYATKAHLVTQNIIARSVYENIKRLIIAKQPYKDGAKNAAIYRNKK